MCCVAPAAASPASRLPVSCGRVSSGAGFDLVAFGAERAVEAWSLGPAGWAALPTAHCDVRTAMQEPMGTFLRPHPCHEVQRDGDALK